MKRKILLPTDFSDNAWNATVYALRLFADKDCSFFFLNTTFLKGSSLSNLSNQLLETMQEDAMTELSELKDLAESSSVNSNHDFDIVLSTDNINKAIKTAVKQFSIDLIIMGTKGATGSKEFFFGSNSVSVIKNITNCSVLIVPEAYDFTTPSQIAFPTDYNRFYGIKELKPLMKLADLYNSKIRIIYINIDKNETLNDFQEYNLMMLQSYLHKYKYSFHWMPNYDKKATVINDFIEELGVNILAMVKYKHNLIEKITKESVIKKLGYHPVVPFLVIPE